MKKMLVLVFWLGFCCLATDANAAIHYINAACASACDGSTWAKGWATFGSATWTRGDTYYVAGGTYAEDATIAAAESGTTWIIVKKANEADNSGDAGWSAAFASVQAVITGRLFINNSYIEIDGVTGSGTTGHGIKIYSTTAPGSVVYLESGKSFIHLHHIEVQGAGFANAADCRGVMQNNMTPVKGQYWSYIHLHDVSTNGYTLDNIVGTSFYDYGLLYENNVIEETGGTTGLDHGQGIQAGAVQSSYWIVRNSVFKNILGTADIAWLGNASQDSILIYNNIFQNDNQSTYSSSPGVIYSRDTNVSSNNIKVYNNTFYNIYKSAVYLSAISTSGNELKNNLFHSGRFTTGHLGITASNNSYYGSTGEGAPVGETGQQNETSDPVANAAGGDFALIAGAKAIDAGADLSSIFTTDKAGLARPIGAAWDIGAYEYGNSPTFTIPVTYDNLTVPISTFTAPTGFTATGYLVKESSTPPLAGDAGWSATAQTSFTFSTTGAHTLYAWVKDGDGNISASANDSVTIPTLTKPTGLRLMQ